MFGAQTAAPASSVAERNVVNETPRTIVLGNEREVDINMSPQCDRRKYRASPRSAQEAAGIRPRAWFPAPLTLRRLSAIIRRSKRALARSMRRGDRMQQRWLAVLVMASCAWAASSMSADAQQRSKLGGKPN